MMKFNAEDVLQVLINENRVVIVRLLSDLGHLTKLYQVFPTVLAALIDDRDKFANGDVREAIALVQVYSDQLVKMMEPTQDEMDWYRIDLKIQALETGYCWSLKFPCLHDKIGPLSYLTVLNILEELEPIGMSFNDKVNLLEAIEGFCPATTALAVSGWMLDHYCTEAHTANFDVMGAFLSDIAHNVSEQL